MPILNRIVSNVKFHFLDTSNLVLTLCTLGFLHPISEPVNGSDTSLRHYLFLTNSLLFRANLISPFTAIVELAGLEWQNLRF